MSEVLKAALIDAFMLGMAAFWLIRAERDHREKRASSLHGFMAFAAAVIIIAAAIFRMRGTP